MSGTDNIREESISPVREARRRDTSQDFQEPPGRGQSRKPDGTLPKASQAAPRPEELVDWAVAGDKISLYKGLARLSEARRGARIERANTVITYLADHPRAPLGAAEAAGDTIDIQDISPALEQALINTVEENKWEQSQ